MPADGSDEYVPVYDLLGGHIIANALLAKYGQMDFEKWVGGPHTATLLAGDHAVRHPLADDIVQSLVGQVPRRFHAKQLWQLVDEPLRGRALRLSARIEPAFLDAATVDTLLDLARGGDVETIYHLWEVRGAPGHPLNAEALDGALRTMTVAERDLRWTEWIRRNNDEAVFRRRRSLLNDLKHLERRWRASDVLSGDRLRARWVMWMLTSTVRPLRDQATLALYWFGRSDPEGLFKLTIDSLGVNDPYVGERMLASSYGVVMSSQRAAPIFQSRLRSFLEQLATAMIVPGANAPTNHYLVRLYVRGIVAFAAKFFPPALPSCFVGTWSFASPTPVQPLVKGVPGADEAGQTLHMDFENYTLGTLFNDRNNYDMNHSGHQAAVAHVRGVVWWLGWRGASFGELDRTIAHAEHSGRADRPRAERYGKKYGWIGFFTYAGILEERGLLPRARDHFSNVDIDPSFPERAPADNGTSVSDAWLSASVESHETWVCSGNTPMLSSLLRRETIGEHRGPWIAVHGFVKASDRILGREAWAFVSALATDKPNSPLFSSALKLGVQPWGARNAPSDHYIFAGEIPWHPDFASLALDEDGYHEDIQIGAATVNVEFLAHNYAWEGYHSEMNRAGGVRVPSRPFSTRFDLSSAPQSFDQLLPDGSRATITLGGVDGLEADILYLREDLLQKYLNGRALVWFAFGGRELRPFPPSPPEWLENALQQQADAWHVVLTQADIKDRTPRPARKRKKTGKATAKRKVGLRSKRLPKRTGRTKQRRRRVPRCEH